LELPLWLWTNETNVTLSGRWPDIIRVADIMAHAGLCLFTENRGFRPFGPKMNILYRFLFSRLFFLYKRYFYEGIYFDRSTNSIIIYDHMSSRTRLMFDNIMTWSWHYKRQAFHHSSCNIILFNILLYYRRINIDQYLHASATFQGGIQSTR